MILKFKEYFKNAEVIKLEQNYRATKTILEHANNLIAHNKRRENKKLFTNNQLG